MKIVPYKLRPAASFYSRTQITARKVTSVILISYTCKHKWVQITLEVKTLKPKILTSEVSHVL